MTSCWSVTPENLRLRKRILNHDDPHEGPEGEQKVSGSLIHKTAHSLLGAYHNPGRLFFFSLLLSHGILKKKEGCL